MFLHLGLFTSLRISDLVILGKQHIQNEVLTIRPGKTDKSTAVLVEIPVLPILRKTIASSKTGDLTFLRSAYGKPFTKNGLGNRVREWCDAAGLSRCTAHGLRKAGATIAAENGATHDELMAIFGWTTKQQTTLYTKATSRKKLAKNAVHKLLREQKETEFVPPLDGVEESGTETPKKLNKNNS